MNEIAVRTQLEYAIAVLPVVAGKSCVFHRECHGSCCWLPLSSCSWFQVSMDNGYEREPDECFCERNKDSVYFVSYPADPLLSDTVTFCLHVSLKKKHVNTMCYLTRLEKKQEREIDWWPLISFWLLLRCPVFFFWHELKAKLLWTWWMAELSASAHSQSPQRPALVLN
jgi:hypothetical protein